MRSGSASSSRSTAVSAISGALTNVAAISVEKTRAVLSVM